MENRNIILCFDKPLKHYYIVTFNLFFICRERFNLLILMSDEWRVFVCLIMFATARTELTIANTSHVTVSQNVNAIRMNSAMITEAEQIQRGSDCGIWLWIRSNEEHSQMGKLKFIIPIVIHIFIFFYPIHRWIRLTFYIYFSNSFRLETIVG